MKRQHLKAYALLLSMVFFMLLLIGCGATQEEGKIPITTKSGEAKEDFLQGRDLFEKLRGQDARPFFEKAIAEDEDFAMAYLFRSFVMPSVKEFWQNLNKAKELIGGVSEGERLWILGVEAGASGLPMKQREMYKQLVEEYPNDERAHNLLGNNYFGQEQYEQAIAEYQRAIQINPNFSQPYNQMGYANRFLENYAEAEKAFQKSQMIPILTIPMPSCL
jgi:tetratricopeptide (TPR) repeat protein